MTTDVKDYGRRNRVTKAIAHNVIFRLLSQGIVALTYVLLVRAFSEHEFGVYQLFYTIPPIVAAVFSLGIAVTVTRYLPEYFARKEFGFARKLLAWAMRLRFTTSVVIVSLTIIFWDKIAPHFNIAEYKQYFYVFGAITVTHFQCRLFTMALSAYLLQQWSMGLTAAFSLAKLLGYCLLLFFGFSLQKALVVDLIAYVLWYFSLSWAYRTHVPQPQTDEQMPANEKKRILRFGLFNNFNDVGSFTLNSRSDNVFIAAFMDPVSVGAYAFSTQLEQMVQKLLPTRFFLPVINAVVYKLDIVTDAKRATEYFVFLVKVNLLCIFPIFVCVAAIPDTLISVIFAGKFIQYTHLLVVIFAFSILSSFQQPVGLIAGLGERADIILASKIFAAYNVITIVILIPLFGVIGAAISTGTAIFFKNVFIWYFVRHVASFRGMARFFIQQVALWSLCWFLLRFIDARFGNYMTIGLTVVIVGVFGLLSLRLADLSPSDREIIGKLSGSRFHRLVQFAGLAP